MNIIYTSIAILGMTAMLDMYMLSIILTDKRVSKEPIIIHRLFTLIGLVLLITYCLADDSGPWASLVVLLIAAIGGAMVFYKNMTDKIPQWFAILHELTAIIGFTLLLVFVFNNE